MTLRRVRSLFGPTCQFEFRPARAAGLRSELRRLPADFFLPGPVYAAIVRADRVRRNLHGMLWRLNGFTGPAVGVGSGILVPYVHLRCRPKNA